MIALSIIVSIQTGFIVWLYGKYWIHNRFIKQMAININNMIIDKEIEKAIENENYELANELKKQKDQL